MRVTIPDHCAATFRGLDVPALFERLHAWIRHHRDDVIVVAARYGSHLEPDPDGLFPEDERRVHTVDLDFTFDVMTEPTWGAG
ncbi:MAG TPA: hypothetical protein VGD67_11410 [Pseudonocardiaceae bacterium]